LGIATGGIGFLLPGMFMGVGTYFLSQDMKKQEEMRIENENYRLDFYVTKALESFEHMMQTLIPYYVSEVNRGFVQCFQQLAISYKPVINLPAVKQELFKQISEYYTFKQLPIDNSVITKKKELIEKVQDTPLLANNYINLLKQEVHFNVPELAEVAKFKGV
jgi:hypothetical protein